MAKNLFNSVPVKVPNRSYFNLSHDVKLSCDMGPLVPTVTIDCVPGDRFRIGCESLIRFAPLVAPVMHEFNVYMHYFFVPYRLLWPNWEDYITNAVDPLPAFPTYPVGDGVWDVGDLADYFGLPDPTGQPEIVQVSALYHAAYQFVYEEWYRDENLVPEVDYELIDGSNAGNLDLPVLRYRAWEKDYFTGALPFAQKGPAVNIPIGALNDVRVNLDIAGVGGDTLGGMQAIGNISSGAYNFQVPLIPSTDVAGASLYAETSSLNLGSTTINDLRRAYRLQEWLEIQARAGSRYVETILGHFGVRSSDRRLDRPEYITGTVSPVRISEVLNTAGGSVPQGEMAGHGIAYSSGKYGSYSVEEHGCIIGIMSITPKPAYQQGIPKHFLKTTDPFEFFWPKFANIGEQPVTFDEIYAYQANGTDTFGYVPRYSEYKFMPSRVCGEFRGSLDHWHAGRIFQTQPTLSQQFIEVLPIDTERIFAVPGASNAHLYVHVYHKIDSLRPMPKYGVPMT